MKYHKIEDGRLTEVHAVLRALLNNLCYGDDRALRELVQKAISNLVTEGPFHEDRWEVVWLPANVQQDFGQPDFIPDAVWPMVRVKTLWAYGSSVITHYCSAEKLRLVYPLGVASATIESGNAECDAVLKSILDTGEPTSWSDFWEKLEEYASEMTCGEERDLFTKSFIDKHTVGPNRWLYSKCQEAWKEYQEDNDGVDFNDDETRTEHIIKFMCEWFREAEPWS